MVLDVVIEEGNPADSSRLLPMIKRIQACYGKLPRQVAADAGYASKENISSIKILGIKAVGLPKKRGMNVEEMTGSEWIYNKLKRFRRDRRQHLDAATGVWFRSLHMERAGALPVLRNVGSASV